MKYFIKQKIFSFKEDMYIKNALDENAYFIDSEFLSLGLNCKIFDINNNLKYSIKEKLLTFLSKYEIFNENDELCAIVSQKMSLFKTKINIDCTFGNIYIEGDFLGLNYNIYVNETLAATVNKKFLSLSDTFEVDILFGDHAFIISLVSIIDNIIDKNS